MWRRRRKKKKRRRRVVEVRRMGGEVAFRWGG
jgi:hypothetical protein